MKRKLLSVLMLMLIGVFVFESSAVDAAYTDFSIKANSSYGAKSTANTKSDDNKLAYVKWNSSSESSHKEWFQIVNSNTEIRSVSTLFSYLGKGYINEYDSVKQTYYYYLRARREHIINPTTTVKGQWES